MKTRLENIMANDAYIPSKRHYSADDFDGYHAAPLLITGKEADPKLVKRQDALAWRMVDAAYGEVVTVAKPSVAIFAAHSTLSRMQQREGMNSISYMHRKFKTPRVELLPDTDPQLVYEACDLALSGGGEPIQNDMARIAFGMQTIELSNVTIFNEFRKELEGPMWRAVSEVTGKDATPKASQMYGLRILGFDRDIFTNQHVGAVRIGMKRLIGELDDGTRVKSRTTAIINTSPSSGFDQDILGEFRQFEGEKDALARMASLMTFQRAIGWIIDTELSAGLVLARNETVYEDGTPCEVKKD